MNRHEKVLIFSQWSSFIQIIVQKLTEHEIGNVWIDGTCSHAVRKNKIAKFKENIGIVVMLATYKVGGVGLNLTNANNVILADLWWNPSVEDQAVDRTHRLGQEKDVNVYKLIVEDSIEGKILKLQDKKRNMRDNIMDESVTDDNNSLTTNDLINLLI